MVEDKKPIVNRIIVITDSFTTNIGEFTEIVAHNIVNGYDYKNEDLWVNTFAARYTYIIKGDAKSSIRLIHKLINGVANHILDMKSRTKTSLDKAVVRENLLNYWLRFYRMKHHYFNYLIPDMVLYLDQQQESLEFRYGFSAALEVNPGSGKYSIYRHPIKDQRFIDNIMDTIYNVFGDKEHSVLVPFEVESNLNTFRKVII